jgi:hypothetical protein
MLNIRDKVRAMCHQLKMHSLLNVEQSAIFDLRSRIAKLPSPEQIASLPKDDLKSLNNRIEHLLHDIDEHSNHRSQQRALRETLQKNGLPPRRKPLLAGRQDEHVFNLKRYAQKISQKSMS